MTRQTVFKFFSSQFLRYRYLKIGISFCCSFENLSYIPGDLPESRHQSRKKLLKAAVNIMKIPTQQLVDSLNV
jgi:hypothetical protein